MLWITEIYKKKLNLFDCISENYLENSASKGCTPTHACAGHITRAVAATDVCLALIGAHQHGIAVVSMNGENPLHTGRVQSITLSARSTQHMWELLAGNRTAVLPRRAQGRRSMDWCMCVPCFKFVFWKKWTKPFYCIKNFKSWLYLANFSRYWSSCFCPSCAHVIWRKI